ncbi:hypothetical protein I6F29_35625 [Bradyrhizobium sp. NBAIM16]|uniref:hypothetical protein n=1 Tax=Bradyrhizobium sp. NBAIM16 TaxID=2793813 RepID=UPI001CD482AA|nr:hypothetical protein [Bradyrhizobium sp. NBAIM16]MCA1431180.1 hypothetical protein [Bradyrhizobium sp. NBAIM16]
MSDTEVQITGDAPDSFVPDKQVRNELGGITATTLRKWERDPRLNFPPRISILERTYRSRKALDEFKQQAIKRGLEVTRIKARGAGADPELRKRKTVRGK